MSDWRDLPCDERFGIVMTGLIFATLSWLHGPESPRIDVRVDSPSPQTLRAQIVQRLVPAHANASDYVSSLAETFAFA